MAKNSSEETQLEAIAKRLLATPHKARDDSTFGKPKAKRKASPKKKAPPKRG
jgi:hypothetical protein